MNRLVLLYQTINRTIQTRSNLILGSLILLGFLRQILVLLAYPPAHGADSMVYFLYAERFAGADILIGSETAYPFYPMLIWASFYALGTIYVLIAIQFVMAVAIAPLYFAALLPYQPIVALISAIVILFDFQTAIVFSFTSTEPIYIFLLAVTIWLCLKALADTQGTHPNYLLLLGLVVALLVLTRPVGRFLVLPVLVLLLLKYRSLKPLLWISISFTLVIVAQIVLFQVFFREGDALASGDSMLAKIMIANPQWVAVTNGENSEVYLEALNGCDDHLFYCISEDSGSWEQGMRVITGAAGETAREHITDIVVAIFQNTNSFMKMSGQQYAGLDTPSQVQCSKTTYAEELSTRSGVMQTTWGWALPDFSEETLRKISTSAQRISVAMCPSAWLPNLTAEQWVDTFANTYRILDRNSASLLYMIMLILVLVVGELRRRYFFPIALVGSFLLNHALISAIAFNVQPRYVLVTNPLRHILLVFLVFSLTTLLAQGFDWLSGKGIKKAIG